MRFIRRCLMAASCVLVFLGSAQAQSTTSVRRPCFRSATAATAIFWLAQSATLAQAATVQSLSFYVTAASGNLILGIYDATGPNGGPGALKASTASFTPGTGWNTANVVTPVSLTAGSYWLAYLPSSNALGFVKTNASGTCAYYSYNFGSLPSKFSTSPASCTPTIWSFYATLTTSASGAPPSTAHAAPRTEPTQRADRQPLQRRHGVDRQRQRPVDMELRRQQRRDNGNLLSVARPSAACQRRVRQRERGGREHRADQPISAAPVRPPTVSGSGPWTWSCAGSNGGATAMCSDSLTSSGGSTGAPALPALRQGSHRRPSPGRFGWLCELDYGGAERDSAHWVNLGDDVDRHRHAVRRLGAGPDDQRLRHRERNADNGVRDWDRRHGNLHGQHLANGRQRGDDGQRHSQPHQDLYDALAERQRRHRANKYSAQRLSSR